jgi:hypothetical protein
MRESLKGRGGEEGGKKPYSEEGGKKFMNK